MVVNIKKITRTTGLFLMLLFFNLTFSQGEEGMWLPFLLEHYVMEDLQQHGFALEAEDIYSINRACLANAVVLFGSGCTAGVVSSEGLLLTNFHCGRSNIQAHSTLGNNYLEKGFWAESRDKELWNPGLTVKFLISVEDVTEQIRESVKDIRDFDLRRLKTIEKVAEIENEASAGTQYIARVESFYYGNEYYLFIYEEFRDIRLVGTPPESIGSFGGDTDNWMWPRHTGDFSIFRIYADAKNRPAAYSKMNVPYKPQKYFPISLNGVEEGDLTVVLGYPARTSEYLTSFAIEYISDISLPNRVTLRDKRLQVINRMMDQNKLVRLQYAAKQSRISNAWKKWQGMITGLQKSKAVDLKKSQEEKFTSWVNSNAENKKKYGSLLEKFKQYYNDLKPYYIAYDFYQEAIMGIEIIKFAGRVAVLNQYISDSADTIPGDLLYSLQKSAYSNLKNYSKDIDKEVFAALMEAYYQRVDPQFFPKELEKMRLKFTGDYQAFAQYVFNHTWFADSAGITKFFSKNTRRQQKILHKDPAILLYNAFTDQFQSTIEPYYILMEERLHNLYGIYIQALREMDQEKVRYPDANRTMRLTYGKVEGYHPKDAVDYIYYTTLEGLMDKNDTSDYYFCVPPKLINLYRNKNFGRYGDHGTMPVCFTASNHTSGGNSGSPVLNAQGQLIGVNFDRNWEGTLSDIFYNPEICRNITVDIRYVLFIIDKFAGASHLIEEMEILE
ncbi:MAG: S46 family peptidase [Bacteroidales bacterium]|nr:S46 family peptidase [Bacteroidales bacterium]